MKSARDRGPPFALHQGVHRWLSGSLLIYTALAQSTVPISAEMEAVWSARQAGNFADAAQHRENARRLLELMPGDAPEFPAWVKAVADLYSTAGRTGEARAVVVRGSELSAASPVNHDELLCQEAERWQAEGNLAKAAALLEQASPGPARDRQLAEVYRQQGRRDAFDAIAMQMRARPVDPQSANRMTDAPESSAPGAEPPAFDCCMNGLAFEIATAAAAQSSAQAAIRDGRIDDGFVYALQSLEQASPGPVDESVFSGIPAVASLLASRQQWGMAETLWDRLFTLVEASRVDTMIPTLRVTRDHARFLMTGCQRIPAARDALDRYRDLLVEAHGRDSVKVGDALSMMVQFEQSCGSPDRARTASEELARLTGGR